MHDNEKEGSVIWVIISFLIPLLGFILYFAWKDNNKKNAECALKGATAGAVFGVIIGICFGLLTACTVQEAIKSVEDSINSPYY